MPSFLLFSLCALLCELIVRAHCAGWSRELVAQLLAGEREEHVVEGGRL